MTGTPRRSIWMDDPQNFERLRQNFTTSLFTHGPNMDLPDMSEKLCEFRRELEATRDALAAANSRIAELEAVRADTRPAPVSVKPLEWLSAGCGVFVADQYSIAHEADDWWILDGLDTEEGDENHKSFAAARDAAQADYEARTLSAIQPAPAVEGLLEALRFYSDRSKWSGNWIYSQDLETGLNILDIGEAPAFDYGETARAALAAVSEPSE